MRCKTLATRTVAEDRQTGGEGLGMKAPTLAQYLVCTTATTTVCHMTQYRHTLTAIFHAYLGVLNPHLWGFLLAICSGVAWLLAPEKDCNFAAP